MRKKRASIRRRLTAPLLATSIALSGLIASGCDRESETNHTNGRAQIVIQNIGSDTMVNLAQAWAEEYATVEPEVSVEVSGGGAGTGVAALINGTADIANCSRQMEPGEIAKVNASDGQKPKENIVGYDALAIFAHKDNPLEEITIERLAAIYSEKGQVRSWADLGIQVPGCQSGEMILVSRQSNSGTYHYFRYFVFREGAGLLWGGRFNVFQFLTSIEWYPTSQSHVRYGALGLIAGALSVTLLAMAIAVPFGVGAAIYVSEFCSPRAVEDLMSRLKGRYTILIVTHNMAQARRASDECVFMLLGELIEHRPTEDLFSNPHNAKTAEYIEGRFG